MIIATCEVLLLGLLITGAVHDVWRFRLPNWLTISTAVAGLPWLLLSLPSLPPILLHVLAAIIMLLVGLLAFRFHMLGGGDVKWLASIAFWVGFNLDFMRFLVLTSFFGGILGLLVLALSRVWPNYGLQDGKRHLPYGVAIAVAGVDFWIRRTQLGQALSALAAS